jgi:hypothetical protein
MAKTGRFSGLRLVRRRAEFNIGIPHPDKRTAAKRLTPLLARFTLRAGRRAQSNNSGLAGVVDDKEKWP